MSIETFNTLFIFVFLIISCVIFTIGQNKWIAANKLKAEYKTKIANLDLFTGDMMQSVIDANPSRVVDTLGRRVTKLSEELGEVSEAYLGVTSEDNAKKKSWEDVREELVDLFVVTVDCLFTRLPIDEGKTDRQVSNEIAAVSVTKLAKWKRGRSTAKQKEPKTDV